MSLPKGYWPWNFFVWKNAENEVCLGTKGKAKAKISVQLTLQQWSALRFTAGAAPTPLEFNLQVDERNRAAYSLLDLRHSTGSSIVSTYKLTHFS